MSAIAGIRHTDGRPVEARALEHMLRSMAHRCPDGIAIWSQDSVGLGHGLLRTHGEDVPQAQPLRDGELAITADVRLDNRDELLSALGVGDPSVSDAAIILAAYRRWGPDCSSRLLGDFAFVLWDGANATLFCARDHFGVKPFYYSASSDRFAFASEIKALLALPGMDREPNEAPIADFLVALVSDSSSTFYSRVLRLPAGHHMTVTPLGRRLQGYWRPEPSPSRVAGDAAEQFRELFFGAVRCRLRGVSSPGAMLSGGLDSSSIACVAEQILRSAPDRSLPTFSFVSDTAAAQSERRSIEAVIAQGSFDPTYLTTDDFVAFGDFDRLLAEQDGIFLAPGLAINGPIYWTAASSGVRVLLDGHGGDEVVSHGYARLRELAEAGRWLHLRREVRAEADILGSSAWRIFALYLSQFGPTGRIVRPLWRAARPVLRRLHRRGLLPAPRPGWRGFINPDFAARTNVAERYRAHRSSIDASTSERAYHLATICDPLQPYALEVLDKAAAAAGVQVRYPFWDKRLAEFCLALPSEAKLSGGWTRMIMRQAMQGVLPSSVQWRRDKHNFIPFLVRGMLKHRRTLLHQILLDDTHDVAGYVNLAAVAAAYHRMAERPEAAHGHDVLAVWRTVALALWLRQLRDASRGVKAVA